MHHYKYKKKNGIKLYIYIYNVLEIYPLNKKIYY